MNQPVAGRLALVTGAAGDIGRAVAVRLAADGASVIAADLAGASEALEETRRRCVAASPSDARMASATFDVTDTSAVEETLEELTSELGPADLLFNNAGYQGQFTNTLDASIDDLRRVVNVNFVGVFAVLQAFAQQLRIAERPGAVVNTASMAGVSGAPNMAAYSSSKAAVIALTKSAAKDLAPLRIRVNAVSPGFIGPGAMWDNQVKQQSDVPSIYYANDVDTVAEQMVNQIPLRRPGTVDEVASIVTFLLSDQSSYLTGQNIEISGGAG